jgi:hypothetical protein
MIEAIILSTLSFIIGGLVGALSAKSLLDSDIKRIVLNSGKRLYMWKGFVDPTLTFVACETGKNGEHIDGDGVVFDEKGNIILVETHDNKG